MKEAIDKESEHKCELMKLISETSETTKKKLLSQQLDKCEEKLESLMMMMVHYCAGLQHCLDMEEAQRRLQVDGLEMKFDRVGEGDGDRDHAGKGRVGEGIGDGEDGIQASGDSDSLDGNEDAGIQFIVTDTELHF